MISEKKTLKCLNVILRYRYIIGLVIFIILVLFKLHGSSIGQWQNFVPTNTEQNYKTNLFGKSRLIRSDEWNVQTPYFLAQSMGNNKFSVINKNITPSGQNMIISYNAPVKDISILAKPFNWGFLLLGKDYGLSWYWCMKIIFLFLLSFEVCMIITKQNKMISVLGAFWITFSPAVQWWFMQHVGDLVFYMEAIIVTFYYMIKNFNRIKLKIIFSLLFSLSCVGFALVIYPAIQIPLAYLCIAFMILIITDYKYKIKFKPIDTIILISTVIFILLMLLHVIMISKEDIKVLLSTTYPGKRISRGGNMPFYSINLYLTNIFLPYKDITFLNNCEISSFINFIPAIILVFPLFIIKKAENLKYGIVFLCFLFIEVFYVLFTIPTIIAKITLLSYVTGSRMMIAYGITSVYLSIWALSVLSKSKYVNKMYSIFVCILITVFYYISIINSPMRTYVPMEYYIILFIVLFILNYLLTQGKKKLFSIIMIVVTLIAGATINPVAKGVGAIYNNNLSYKLQDIGRSDPQAYWISANDQAGYSMGTFLYTNGLKTLNGTNFYPDLNKWYKIDKNREYFYIYNRYEHITVNITNEKTDVKLLHQDSVELNLNVEDLRKLDIKYVLTKDNLTKYNKYENISFQCIYSKNINGYYIFKVLYK